LWRVIPNRTSKAKNNHTEASATGNIDARTAEKVYPNIFAKSARHGTCHPNIAVAQPLYTK
jgi:predicted ABC-type transport system involved in lysophospholipase L1 biosynthesis ATPase subunit